MAWTDAALEEMGLAHVWVRRDTHADDAGATVDDVRVTGEGGAAQAPVVADARPSGVAAARSSAEAAVPAPHSADRVPAFDAGRDRGASETLPGETGDLPPAATEPAIDNDDFAWFDTAAPADLDRPAADARPAERPTAELDWDALGARVADCTRCRLCEKRTQAVFGVGDREADWMLIGEAPGENEDRQGEPFVGQAGKLLDNMLHALSLKRGENVYIANVIKCRPPGNRNPEPDEVASCAPYLQRQVALVKPKLIVAFGRFAAQTLLKTGSSIASMRGRVHEYEGVPVVVTYHPAYLLRSLQDKSKAWADLCLARDTFLRAAPGPTPSRDGADDASRP